MLFRVMTPKGIYAPDVEADTIDAAAGVAARRGDDVLDIMDGMVIVADDKVIVSWSRGYARGTGGSTSTFLGHPAEEAAIKDAGDCFLSRGVRQVWVRPVYDNGELGDVTWQRSR
jgi:hypothetical protein